MTTEIVSETAAVEAAAMAFWGEIAGSFPEMTTGDSQLSGEDEAAMALWLLGEPGDRPVAHEGQRLPIPAWVPDKRVAAAVDAGLVAAKSVLLECNQALSAAPGPVRSQLDNCVRHVLHWNMPASRPRKTRSQAIATA